MHGCSIHSTSLLSSAPAYMDAYVRTYSIVIVAYSLKSRELFGIMITLISWVDFNFLRYNGETLSLSFQMNVHGSRISLYKLSLSPPLHIHTYTYILTYITFIIIAGKCMCVCTYLLLYSMYTAYSGYG